MRNPPHPRNRRHPCRVLAPWALALCGGFWPCAAAHGQATPDGERLTVQQVLTLLQKPTTPARVTSMVLEGCMLDGPPSSAQTSQLQAAGATPALLKAMALNHCLEPPRGPAAVSTAAPQPVSAAALGVGFGAEQFALIPAGSFQMGTPSGGDSDERPVRTVTLSAFRIQKTEVTQGQWRQVMAGTALANPSGFSSCGDTCPVERVSWNDIQQFLTRLNQIDPGKGYRLPTEAEWEYAARAGTTGDYGITGEVCSFARISACSQSRTWPVAQRPANAWGLHDMHGNVFEWVQDRYGTYPSTSQTNPTAPATGSSRVLRGGS